MVVLNSGILAAQVKDFEIFDFPFMFANAKEADAVVDGPFGKKMQAKLEEKGIVGLAYWELGFRKITNSKRPVNKVEDIAGLKLRVIPNPINVDWVKALGANPTPLAFPELYAALEQKAIDGQENPLIGDPGEQVLRSAEVPDADQPPVQPAVADLQQEVLGHAVAGREEDPRGSRRSKPPKYQRQVNRDAAAGQLDALKKAGMQVSEFSPAEQAKLREKIKPVIEKHGAAIPATVAELQAELAKLRK